MNCNTTHYRANSSSVPGDPTHPFEFGQHYQLSGTYEGKWVHFSLRFIAHNIAVYFFQPLRWDWTFPFARAEGIPVDLPGYFGTEEVSGLAVTFPYIWFVLGLPLIGWRRPPLTRASLMAVMAGALGALLPVAALLLSYFSTTTRYQPDFAVLFGLLALTGLLAVERAGQGVRWLRWSVVSVAVVAGAVTVVVGTLASFDYHGRALGRARPALWAELATSAEGVLGEVGRRWGQFDGPQVLKVRFASRPAGTRETFWTATDPRAPERLLVEHHGERLIRFGYQRADGPVNWGRPLRWELNHTHTVSIQLPSLYGPPRGAMRELRHAFEFHERTGVAVWFSGGRALDAIVEPWPADLLRGGEVGQDFSGRVRARSGRLFRAEEVRDPVMVPAHEPRGGTLQLSVILPDSLTARGEPLFAVGAHYGSDMIFVRAADGGFQVVFEHYGSPSLASPVLPLTGRRQEFELTLPSCARGEKAFGDYATGEVVVRVDGRDLLRVPQQPCYGFAPGSEAIGRNPFGTTCGPVFRGWIIEARWINPP